MDLLYMISYENMKVFGYVVNVFYYYFIICLKEFSNILVIKFMVKLLIYFD